MIAFKRKKPFLKGVGVGVAAEKDAEKKNKKKKLETNQQLCHLDLKSSRDLLR